MTENPQTPETIIPRHSDADSVRYFDEHVHAYSDFRLQRVADYVAGHAGSGASLIDLGCGVGNTLDFVSRAAGIEELGAMDVSQSCLEKTSDLVDAELFHGSILDDEFVSSIGARYDFAVVAAVLHHLVGQTRRESRANARRAIENSMKLLKPGGRLVVVEPVFRPERAMDAVFWLKRGVSKVTSNRVGVLGYWGNIGQPVVSYYSAEELLGMLIAGDANTVTGFWLDPVQLTFPLNLIFGRNEVTAVVGRSGEA